MKKKILLMFMVLMSAMTLWAQTLTINQPDPCTITASNPTPAPGETVTLTVNFNGCAFVLWTVNDLMVMDVNNNLPISVSPVPGTPDPLYYFDGPGNYTFIMPAFDVDVSVWLRDVRPVNIQAPYNGSGSCKIDQIDGWPVPNSIFTTDQYVEAFGGMDVQLNSTAAPGYEIASYYVVAPPNTGSGMIVDVNQGERFNMPPDPVDVYPNFKPQGEFFVNIDPNIDPGQLMVQAVPSFPPTGTEIVTLNITPQTVDVVVNDISVRFLDNNPAMTVFIQDGDFKFEMLGQDAAVYVTWDNIPDGPNPHDVNIDPLISNGQVQIVTPFDVAPNLMLPDNLVQVYPLPDPGFMPNQIFVKYFLPNNTFTLEILPNSSNEYWFTMPGCPVEVTATFTPTTLTNVYTLYVQNDNVDGYMDIRIHGDTLPHTVINNANGSFDLYYPVFKDDIISVTAYPNAGYGIYEFHLQDQYGNVLGIYSPNSNGTTSFPMPAQDAYLFAIIRPLLTLEVERGNPSFGTLEVVNINGATPPTPTVNTFNNYEYQIFVDDVVDVRCNPANGYRVSNIILEETGTQALIQDYGNVPSASVAIPNIEGVTQMTLRAEYAPYLLTLAVDRTKVTVNSINGQTVTPASQNGDYDIYYVYENDKIDVTAITPTGYNFNQFEFRAFDATNPYIPYPGNANAVLDMPSYDVMLTAAFTPIDYVLRVIQWYRGPYETKLVDTNGMYMSPFSQTFGSPGYDYYKVHVGDEIGVEILSIPDPNVFVSHFELRPRGQLTPVLGTYAGPSVPKIVMLAQDMDLEAYLFNGVAPWQAGAYALKIDRNTPNGTLSVANGTAPFYRQCDDYVIYYPVNPGQSIDIDVYSQFSCLNYSALYDTHIFPTNFIEDWNSGNWTWSYPGIPNTVRFTFNMPGQDALLTGIFQCDTLELEVQQMDQYGNKVKILVNGEPGRLMSTDYANGNTYEYYAVVLDDVITVIGEPLEGFAVKEIDVYDWYQNSPYPSNLVYPLPPAEGPLYPTSLTTATFTIDPYCTFSVVVDFQPGHMLQVDQRAPNGTGNMTDGSLTEVYRNGVLMTPIGTSPNSIDYFPIYENDVVIVRNVPDPGYTNFQYELNGIPFPPDVVPTTGTFVMPGFNSYLTGQFALDTYNINIRSRGGSTYAHNNMPFTMNTRITTGQVGNTVYIEFDPNIDYEFDPNYFTVTYSGGADAQPTLLPTSGPPYTHASFNWLLPEDVDINVVYKSTMSYIRGDIDRSGDVGISDLSALIDYILSGNVNGINVAACDCDRNGRVDISDVSALIDRILSGQW